jgi:general nucleoside transport system ATP-binding protein
VTASLPIASSGAVSPTRDAPAPGAPPELVATGVGKTFGSLVALDDVSITLRPGSFHALLGENGAGKSTLVKCIMGYYQADRGHITIGGQSVVVKNPREAQARGVGMVYQHFTLVANMSVAENLVLSRAKLPFFIDWAREEAKLRAFMAGMPFQIDPARLVRSLAAGEKQKLEILKQLYLGSRIMILDEPTSVLTPAEADEVLGLLRGMAGDGKISVLMISHKFREVTRFADEVTVLRKGRMGGSGLVRDLTPAGMAVMMVGAEPPQASKARNSEPAQDQRLVLRDVTAIDDKGLPVLKGISLEVCGGEIVGIAGVSGNGQEELVEVLSGQRERGSGDVMVGGRKYTPIRAQMTEQRLRCLPEEPLRNACVPSMSVAANIGFRNYDQPAFTLGGWAVRWKALRRQASGRVAEYGIKTPSVDAPIGTLSGGNVQRAVLSRELGGEVRVLVAANPCFGLDFAAVAEIRTRLLQARNAGAAVLLISADLDEIFALADRILVMSEGRIVHESPVATADVGTVGRFMAGHA